MSTWGEQLLELAALQRKMPQPQLPEAGQPSPHDVLRRKYLKVLSDHTSRAAIVYATAWLETRPVQPPGDAYSINLGDVQGFMEACSNIAGRELDLIITSPGGSAEAADSVMAYLRTRFDHIRAVIPVAAMSAATMMALACDEIVMASHSQLGPIDPQFTVYTPEGPRLAAGQAILDQFDLAKRECQDPSNIGAWLPMLRSLLPGLIAHCGHQRALAEEFATRSLVEHMFSGRENGQELAAKAAAWFADFTTFKSHGRRVSRDDARQLELQVTDLEDDPRLQDLVLSVHHAVRHTFTGTGANKIIENHLGRAYIEAMHVVQQVVQGPTRPQSPAPQPGHPLGVSNGPGTLQPNRAERRRQQRKK